MLQHYRYPLRVWLSSLILGTTLYSIYDVIQSWNYRSDYMIGIEPYFYILILAISLLCSIPCLILFVVLYNFLLNTKLTVFKVKLILFLISEGFIVFWMYSLMDGGSNHSVLRYLNLIAPYSIAIGVSIWFYKLKRIDNEA